MTKNIAKKELIWVAAVVLAAGLVAFAANAGRMLVVDAPQPSDVILVLAGETDRRPERALQLLDQGYARRVVIDVPATARVYDFTQVELAQKYVHGLPEAASVHICPIWGALDPRRGARRGKMSGGRRGQPDPDRHLRVPHPPRVEHFPSRGSGEIFLGGSSAGRHAIWNSMVDPPAMGQNLSGRMAAAGMVEWCRAMALTR